MHEELPNLAVGLVDACISFMVSKTNCTVDKWDSSLAMWAQIIMTIEYCSSLRVKGL